MKILDENGVPTSQFDLTVYLDSSFGKRHLSKNPYALKDFEKLIEETEKEEVATVDETRSRLRPVFEGCMLGLAIGDALGAPFKDLKNDQVVAGVGERQVKDFMSWGDFGAGSYTANTQLSIASAVSGYRYAEYGTARGIGHFPSIVHREYFRWNYLQRFPHYQRGPTDSCKEALLSVTRYGEKASNTSKDTGAVVRIAPLGLMVAPSYAFKGAVSSAILTHAHPTAYLSAGFFAALIAFVVRGETLYSAVQKSLELLATHERSGEIEIAVEGAVSMALTDRPVQESIASLGHGFDAHEAMAIAVFCALRFQNDFENGVLTSVKHSGNSHTIGCMTGALLGALLGVDQIPSRWKEQVEDQSDLKKLAESLLIVVSLQLMWDLG